MPLCITPFGCSFNFKFLAFLTSLRAEDAHSHRSLCRRQLSAPFGSFDHDSTPKNTVLSNYSGIHIMATTGDTNFHLTARPWGSNNVTASDLLARVKGEVAYLASLEKSDGSI